MDAARHEEVARALGRGSREDRRCEFVEANRLHRRAHVVDDLHAHHDVVVQLLATQVEETIRQARILGVFKIAEHRNRQFLGFAQHFERGHEHLDVPGRQVGVLGAGGALAHLAVDADHPFRAHLLGVLERRAIRIDHDLGHAVVIAQVDEQHAAVVADAVAPAGKPGGFTDVLGAQGAAGVGAIAMHGGGHLSNVIPDGNRAKNRLKVSFYAPAQRDSMTDSPPAGHSRGTRAAPPPDCQAFKRD